MSSLSGIYDLLLADTDSGGIVDLATGGIYIRTDLDREGLSRSNPETANAYDGLLLKPTLVLRPRDQNRTFGGLLDLEEKVRSTRQIIEVYIHSDGNSGKEIFDLLSNRISFVLDGTSLNGGGICQWQYELDPELNIMLNQAYTARIDFEVIRVRQV